MSAVVSKPGICKYVIRLDVCENSVFMYVTRLCECEIVCVVDI